MSGGVRMPTDHDTRLTEPSRILFPCRLVRACKTQQDEREVIQKECASVRTPPPPHVCLQLYGGCACAHASLPWVVAIRDRL
jgi:hypothetical protein